MDKRVPGDRIKELRLAANLTLKDVEARAEVSATHVSEIERGLTSPTVGALVRIARALGVTPSLLVEPSADERRARVVRRAERCRLQQGSTGVALDVLSAGGEELSLIEVTVAGGGGEEPLPLMRGEVFVHVLEGAVDVRGEQEGIRLEVGDSLHATADGRMRVSSPGPDAARVLFATVPAIRL